MTSGGSPEIQNWIPFNILAPVHYAAWEVSLGGGGIYGDFGLLVVIEESSIRQSDRGESFLSSEPQLWRPCATRPPSALTPIYRLIPAQLWYWR